MEKLDVRGLACPEPVIRARKALEANPNAVLEVLTDSAATRANIARMAQSLGASVVTQELPGGQFQLTITAGQPAALTTPAPQAEPCAAHAGAARAVVFINNSVVGIGDDRLGRILMKAFLKTLKSAEPLPAAIVCVNAGVHLTTEDSEELTTLGELAALGVEIISCGTCLDFFGKLDKVRVGAVGNMLEIVGRLNRAPKIIAP